MDRQEIVDNFTATGLSLAAAMRIKAICDEELANGTDRKLIADALMGAALNLAQDRDGMIGRMVYLRTVADQIEKALTDPSPKLS